MYLGVDIGGTKTLMAVLSARGEITEQVKFPTPVSYDDFLSKFSDAISGFSTREYQAAAMGIPVVVYDRTNHIAVNFGNQNWHNIAIQADIEALINCPVIVENDAKVGGLAEAKLVQDQYKRVVYVAIGTGIGYALIHDLEIDTNIGDSGGRNLLFEHEGRLTPWEAFASGKAFAARLGKPLTEVTDPEAWRRVARDLSRGLIELTAMLEPEVIIIGGGVGASFDQYADLLRTELKTYEVPLLTIPALLQAKRPEEAVIHGCYDLIMQEMPHHAAAAR